MSKILITVLASVIVILVSLGAWWSLTAKPTEIVPKSNTSNNNETASLTIIFTDNGFQQQSYSIVAGETVAVKNESPMIIKFSSDEHPTHTENTELNMESLNPGEQGLFTPTRAGEWGVHDHEHPEFTTKLIVTN